MLTSPTAIEATASSCAWCGKRRSSSEDFSLPKHLEEIRHIDEFFVVGDSRDRVERYQNQSGIGVFFLESFQTGLVLGLDFFA